MLGSYKVPGVQQRARTSTFGECRCQAADLRGPGSFIAPSRSLGGVYGLTPTAYGLTPTEASGYIVGWLQEAEKEAPAGPNREAVAALLRFYSAGGLLTESSGYQLRTVYPVVLQTAPQTAAKMRRQVQAIGTATEKKAVQAAVVAAKEAGIGGSDSSGIPQWAIIAGAGAGTLVLVGLLAWGLSSRGGP